MKIAIVAQALDTHSGSRVGLELARQFSKFKNEVIFYSHSDLSKKYARDDLKKSKVKIKLIKSPKIIFFGRFISTGKIFLDLKKERPDLILAHTTLHLLLGAKLSRFPLVITYQGTQLDIWLDRIFPKRPNFSDLFVNRKINWAIKTMTRFQLSLSEKSVTISKYCRDEAKKLYGKKSIPIAWGSCPPTIANRSKLAEHSKTINLLSVSRFVPYKGFHYLIEAVESLNREFEDLRLTLIGSQGNKKYLTFLRKRKLKNVEIVFNPDDETLARYYQKADIYLTCDKFLFFGEPIFEAAYFSKPTIAMDFASVREAVRNNETGIIVKNQKELERAIARLAKNPKEREKLGKNAQKYAREYTWEKCAKTYLGYFEKWLKIKS